ncbi:MAG: DUF1573 domain-containing protein [Bacteroidota bacterium]|nr:DUF1573 domain-containing protein [Bacteroidota bacterium]
MKKAILTVGAIFLFAITAVRAQGDSKVVNANASNPNAPVISFDNKVHDYGTIKQDGDPNCEFTFKNTGKEPLILTNCRASCGCTVPDWPKEPILPGKTGKIKVHYDTHRIGQFNKTITVTSNAKNSEEMITIKGNVEAPPAAPSGK